MDIYLTPFDPNNPEHATFLFKLGKEVGKTLWDDRHRDPILMLQELGRRTSQDKPTVYLVELEGKFIGYIAVIIDTYGIGYIDGAALPEYQRFYPAKNTLKLFAEHCFNYMGVYKLKAQVPVFNHAAEKVARSIGFRKEGISKRELLFNGRRTDVLELALFPEYLRG